MVLALQQKLTSTVFLLSSLGGKSPSLPGKMNGIPGLDALDILAMLCGMIPNRNIFL